MRQLTCSRDEMAGRLVTDWTGAGALRQHVRPVLEHGVHSAGEMAVAEPPLHTVHVVHTV